MPAGNITTKKIEAPVLTFDDNIFQADDSTSPTGMWRDFACIIYSLPGRGKSSFLKSVVEAWGPEAITALDIEKRLYQLKPAVPRITIPDLTPYPESEHYTRLLLWLDMVLDRAERRAAPFNPKSRVIALDTFNTLYDHLLEADRVRHYAGIPSKQDLPREKWLYDYRWYMPLYNDILKRFNRMLDLTDACGYSVILTCHVALKHRTVEDKEIDQYEPQLPPVLQSIINKRIHTAFYLKASDGTIPNYFVTSASDSIPAKDQTGMFPRMLWPTWAAINAIQLGDDPSGFKPTNVKLAKKEKVDEKK